MPEIFYTVVHYDTIDASVYHYRDIESAKEYARSIANECRYTEVKSDNYLLLFSNGDGYVEVVQSTFRN